MAEERLRRPEPSNTEGGSAAPLLLVVTGMMILKAGTTYLDSAPVHAHNALALLDAYAHVLNHCRPAAAWDCKSPVRFKHKQGF